MDTPRVSVVVTCYNYGQYLRGCLESVLAQTWRDLEIIVVNDGSHDDTDKIMASYRGHPRIVYVNQENAGQARAKNNGIRHARGELIAFLDADDLWEPTKLEEQIPLFQDTAVGVVYSTARFIDEQGIDVTFRHESKYLRPRSGMVTRYLFFDNFIPFSSSVVRRECFDRLGCFDEGLSMGIDWDLWLRFSVDYQMRFVDKPLLLYRQGHAGQMSKNLELRHKCSDAIITRFIENHPEQVGSVLKRRMWQYTFLNRGLYFRGLDLKKSSTYFAMAIGQWPFALGPYKGLLKNLFMVCMH